MFVNIDRAKSQSIVKTQATIAKWLTAFLAIALQTAAPRDSTGANIDIFLRKSAQQKRAHSLEHTPLFFEICKMLLQFTQ
jgi:hypothetical protein